MHLLKKRQYKIFKIYILFYLTLAIWCKNTYFYSNEREFRHNIELNFHNNHLLIITMNYFKKELYE